MLNFYNRNISVYVSTNKDPYVYAQYNGTMHFSNKAKTYLNVGVWLLAISCLLVLVPIFIIYKNKQSEPRDLTVFGNVQRIESSYFNLSGDQSKLELTQIMKSTGDESFKNVAKRI